MLRSICWRPETSQFCTMLGDLLCAWHSSWRRQSTVYWWCLWQAFWGGVRRRDDDPEHRRINRCHLLFFLVIQQPDVCNVLAHATFDICGARNESEETYMCRNDSQENPVDRACLTVVQVCVILHHLPCIWSIHIHNTLQWP